MIEIGDLIKHKRKNSQGVVIAMKKANNNAMCKAFHNAFMVYYVLLCTGDIDGPLFYGEISPM